MEISVEILSHMKRRTSQSSNSLKNNVRLLNFPLKWDILPINCQIISNFILNHALSQQRCWTFWKFHLNQTFSNNTTKPLQVSIHTRHSPNNTSAPSQIFTQLRHFPKPLLDHLKCSPNIHFPKKQNKKNQPSSSFHSHQIAFQQQR